MNRLGSMHRASLAVIALAATLSACTAEGSSGVACPDIALRPGISVDIDQAFAPQVTSVDVKACWDGDCRTMRPELEMSTAAGTTSCSSSGVCGAQVVPTGRKNAFADIANLPGKPIDITLSMGGTTIAPQQLRVTPKTAAPGPCAGDLRQAGILVGPDGRASERP